MVLVTNSRSEDILLATAVLVVLFDPSLEVVPVENVYVAILKLKVLPIRMIFEIYDANGSLLRHFGFLTNCRHFVTEGFVHWSTDNRDILHAISKLCLSLLVAHEATWESKAGCDADAGAAHERDKVDPDHGLKESTIYPLVVASFVPLHVLVIRLSKHDDAAPNGEAKFNESAQILESLTWLAKTFHTFIMLAAEAE